MQARWILVVALLGGGCKKDTAKDQDKWTGSAVVQAVAAEPGASGSGSSAGSASAEPAMCETAGTYRFRFESNGHKGWWFRAEVSGTPATAKLLEAPKVLGLEAGPLTVAIDGCKVTFTTTGAAVGELKVVLAINPKTHELIGTMTRTAPADEKVREQAVTGVHDLAPPRPAAACIVPGLYEIQVGADAKWRNTNADDARPCTDADLLTTIVKVEPFGAITAITLREGLTPHDEASGTDENTRIDNCTYNLKLSGANFRLAGKITFDGAKAIGTATEVVTQIVEDGDQGQGTWECISKVGTLTLAPPRD